MKKEVENKNSFITDLSSSESSGDESEKEIPIENKEEIKKVIEKYLLTDEKPKKTIQKKTSLSKKENHLPAIVMIRKNQLKQSNQSKNQRNSLPKIHSRKHCERR